VATKRWILVLLLAAMISVLSGCNGGSTANVQNPPPPPPSDVTISVQTAGLSNGMVPVNGTASFTATVQGTPAEVGEGVAWSMTCPVDPNNKLGLCGTLSSPVSASGAAITYTAPAAISSNSMVVEIVAYAEALETANEVSPITISTFDSGLKAGNYVLQAQGIENFSPYQLAGVITLDGQGNVTAGEQTVNSNGVSVTDNILPTGSSYFLGSDGRGEITLNTGDNSIGGNGVETFTFVFLNNSQNPQALISQFDILPAQTGASATGTMDLQNSAAIGATPSGSYVFVMSGTDVLDNDVPIAFGGVLEIASGQTAISGVTDEIIAETQRLSSVAFSAGSKISSGPDTFGQVTFKLLGYFGASHPQPITVLLAGYIVDAAHIKLIETDTNEDSGVTAFAETGGLAVAQAPGSYGTFTNASLPSGTTYVFGVTGVDLSENSAGNGYLPSTLTSAGLFQVDGSGDLNNGYTDTFLLYNTVQKNPEPGAQISSQFSGTYSVDPSGTGRTILNGFTFGSAPNPSYRPEFFFYLTGLTGTEPAALVLGIGDPGPQANQHYPSLGAGIAYEQSTAPPAFSGDFGAFFTQQNGSENDGTAQFNANSTAQTLTGLADTSINSGLSSLPDQGFGGTFISPSTSIPFIPFSGVLENVNQSNAFTVGNNSNNQFTVDYYIIDPNHGFFVETDLVNTIPPASPPTSSGQLSFGSYVSRTPVCSGCP
jgi:hypothetical protein